MNASGLACLTRLLATAVIGSCAVAGAAATNANFLACLTSGSLGGISFAVHYSYDAAGVTGGREDYLQLLSFDFNLRGTQFSRTNIQQGGQVIFHYGQLYNITAEFYPAIEGPADAPVNQIAFGFGGPGSIGYSDTNGQYGSGSYPLGLTDSPALLALRMYGHYAGLTISGTPGATCVLKYSTNLFLSTAPGWTPLATNRLACSNWFYLDAASLSSSRRFYAVEIAP